MTLTAGFSSLSRTGYLVQFHKIFLCTQYVFQASLVAQMVKNLTAMQETQGSIPGSGRSPGEGNGKPTPVFLPRESHGQRSLACYRTWSCKESDTTEQLTTHARACAHTHNMCLTPGNKEDIGPDPKTKTSCQLVSNILSSGNKHTHITIQ